MANKGQSPEVSTRKWLAVAIVCASIAGIVVISAIAIGLAGSSRADTSRLVFSSVLPLLGTWVGTVLAFYFARENFQAATENTLRLAGLDTDTPVVRVMIRESDIVAYDLGPGERVEDVPLATVRQRMQGFVPPSRRLPIRNASGAVLYVIHDSTLTAYADSVGQPTVALNRTIGDMLNVAEYKQLIEAIGFVAERATVADARAVMVSVINCNDVFVTTSGKRDERAIGWLTNTLLAGIQ
jgi:hypothetical protein